MRHWTAFTGLVVATVAIGLSVVACQGGDGTASSEPPEQSAQRVEVPALGIALAEVPAGVEVVSMDETTVRLSPADGVAGDVVLDVRAPESGGVNLVAAVQAHQRDIQSRADGSYHGSQELRTQLGPAFTSRGSYVKADGGAVQELHVYALHPRGDAMLRLLTELPSDEDPSARAQTMLELLAQVEALSGGTGASEGL